MELADYVIDEELLARLLGDPRRATSPQRWLAVGVTGRALLEKTWVDDAEVNAPLFQKLREARAPEPDLEKGNDYRTLDPESHDAPLTRCRACAVTPGWSLCSACSGRGTIQLGGDETMTCRSCDGAAKAPCPTCEGKKQSYDVRIVYHNARPVLFAHVFVPKEIAWLRTSVIELVKRQETIPPSLVVDLAHAFAPRDAYRGTSGDPAHQGHRFGSSLEDARLYLKRIASSPSVLASRHQAMVWPIVIVADRSPAAFAMNGDGTPTRLW